MNIRNALALLACCLGFAALDARAETEIGLHVASLHVPQKEHQSNDNPGGYFKVDDFVFGGYRNSIGRNTFYAAYVHDLGHGFDVSIGFATGYQKKCTERIVVVDERVVVEHREDGSTVRSTYRDRESRRFCSGFSRGALTPALAITYTSPVKFLGQTPFVKLVPGTGKSSTVVHFGVRVEFQL